MQAHACAIFLEADQSTCLTTSCSDGRNCSISGTSSSDAAASALRIEEVTLVLFQGLLQPPPYSQQPPTHSLLIPFNAGLSGFRFSCINSILYLELVEAKAYSGYRPMSV